MEALRGAGKLTAKPGKASDVLQIGGWWHRDAGGRPTGSWAPPVVDERYIVGFLWSVLSRKWGRKLGKQVVMNQVLAFGGCFGAGRSAPGLFAADGGLTSSCLTRSGPAPWAGYCGWEIGVLFYGLAMVRVCIQSFNKHSARHIELFDQL